MTCTGCKLACVLDYPFYSSTHAVRALSNVFIPYGRHGMSITCTSGHLYVARCQTSTVSQLYFFLIKEKAVKQFRPVVNCGGHHYCFCCTLRYYEGYCADHCAGGCGPCTEEYDTGHMRGDYWMITSSTKSPPCPACHLSLDWGRMDDFQCGTD